MTEGTRTAFGELARVFVVSAVFGWFVGVPVVRHCETAECVSPRRHRRDLVGGMIMTACVYMALFEHQNTQ